jgi:hypothetical protein
MIPIVSGVFKAYESLEQTSVRHLMSILKCSWCTDHISPYICHLYHLFLKPMMLDICSASAILRLTSQHRKHDSAKGTELVTDCNRKGPWMNRVLFVVSF